MKTINAEITFEGGEIIRLELYPDVAPKSVERFVALVKAGFYNGLIFHRVIPNFMIQGGGMDAQMKEKKDKKWGTIKGEFAENGVANNLKHETGVISMARTNVMDSATTQFFICTADCAFLDGAYAAFGKVSDNASMTTAQEISMVETGRSGHHSDVPLKPIIIKSVKII